MRMITFLLCLLSFHSWSETKQVSIDSAIIDEKVTVQVSLPDTYYHSDTFQYPLLLVLDGTMHLNHIAANSQFLSSYAIMPEMIVVGVNIRQRLKYFTHTEHKDFLGRSGNAEQFATFITNELINKLKDTYRIAPYTMITGHSLSGLFTSYLVLNNVTEINAAISISPSLWYDQKELVRNYAKYNSAKPGKTVKWFLSMASEPGEMKEAYGELLDKLEQQPLKNVSSSWAWLPEETHDSTPLLGNVQALKNIFKGWNAVPQIDVMSLNQLVKVYQGKAREYGYEFPLSAHQYNVYGLKAAYEGKVNWGIEILEKGVSMFPHSEILWDSLATAYSLNQNSEKAVAASDQALALAKLSNSMFLNDIANQNENLKTNNQ